MKKRYSGIIIAARLMLASLLAVSVFMLASCKVSTAYEAKVASDLEDMRYVELDAETDAELESLLSEQGREYFEMFLGKAGEFDYKITGSDEADDGETVIVHVRINTYDFGSEYLKSWSEFLESSGEEYDSAVLYETLFRNLSNIQSKDYYADADITCTMDENGEWQTDAKSNTALRNAILGGMINEISGLADI